MSRPTLLESVQKQFENAQDSKFDKDNTNDDIAVNEGKIKGKYIVYGYEGSYQFYGSTDKDLEINDLDEAKKLAKEKIASAVEYRKSKDGYWSTVVDKNGEEVARFTEKDVK